MDKKQQESRRTAAREFMSSLHELETVFQSEASVTASDAEPQATVPPSPAPPADDLEMLLQDAVQDIEQFMSHQSDEAG